MTQRNDRQPHRGGSGEPVRCAQTQVLHHGWLLHSLGTVLWAGSWDSSGPHHSKSLGPCSALDSRLPTVFKFWGNQRLSSSSKEATGLPYTHSFPHAPSKCLLNPYLPGPLWGHKSPPLPQGQHLKTRSKGPVGVAHCSQEAGLQDPQVRGEGCFHGSKSSSASSVVLV